MSKDRSVNDILLRHQKLTRFVSVLLVVCAAVAYYLSAMAYHDPAQSYRLGTNFVVQNVGGFLILIEFFLALILKNLHDGVYWFFWLQLKKVTLTKHELQMRQRVFTRSYGYAVVVVALAMMQANTIVHFDSIASGNLMPKLGWITFIFLAALPSIIASWEPYQEQV